MFAYEDFYNDGDGRFEGIEDARIVGISPLFNDKITVYNLLLIITKQLHKFRILNRFEIIWNLIWDQINYTSNFVKRVLHFLLRFQLIIRWTMMSLVNWSKLLKLLLTLLR